MRIQKNICEKIGVALNEATLLGIEFDMENNIICSFELIAIDESGNIPNTNKLSLKLHSVKRFVSSLRNGNWDDQDAEAITFAPHEISAYIQKFEQQPIYGWNFINSDDANFNKWKNRLSFDFSLSKITEATNTIDLFQEGFKKHIDLRIWFDHFEILTEAGLPYSLQNFLENGKRGWDAIYNHSEKTRRFGITPIIPDKKQH